MQFHPLGFYRTKVAFTLMCMNLLELDRVGNPNDQFESNGDVKKFIILNTIQSNGKKNSQQELSKRDANNDKTFNFNNFFKF